MKRKLLFNQKLRTAFLICVLVLGGAIASAQSFIPIPAHNSTYNGSARGYWFTAPPVAFFITGVRVPTNASTGAQNVHLVKFNAGPPPNYGASTTNFTTLGYWNNVAGTAIIPTQILVNPGDIIGVLATRGTNSNSYSVSAPSFASSVLGMPITLKRLLHQGYINTNPAPNFSTETNGGPISRVELYYAPAVSAPDDAQITEITSPGVFCSGAYEPLTVRLKNSGTNVLDSCMVVWDVNGTLDSSWYTVNLDTLLGTGSNDTLITIDSLTLGASYTNITVYPKWPNGVADTLNTYDTAAVSLFPALNGTFVIDPSGAGDFISFTDAVNALGAFGICGATTFEAVDGTYAEQIEVPAVSGMSSTNTVRFTSQSGHPDSVILAYSAVGTSDNFVVNFTGASYFMFDNLTFQSLGTSYTRVITTPTSGGSDHISFDNCVMEAAVSTSTSTYRAIAYIYGANNEDWTFTNNTFLNGSDGLYLYGNFTDRGKNNVVTGNKFINQYYRSAYVYYQNDCIFSNNHATSNTTYLYGYGFYMSQLTRGEVNGNFIEGTTGWPRYGFYMITVQGDLNNFLSVVNNRIYMPYAGGTYGMYISNNLFVDYSHNSIFMASTSSSSRAVYATSGGYNKFINNIVQHTGLGYGFYVSGTPMYQMDYNNLNVPNGNVGYFSGDQTSLGDWQLATGYDSNSISVTNIFSDTATLKVCTDSLFGKGVSLPLYAADFEGDLRQSPPCIGADEFMPVSMFGFATDPVLCDGDTLVFTQYYYDTVVWNSVDTSNTLIVTGSGSQWVSVYDACGTATDTFNVIGQDQPSLADTNLCEGTTAVLSTGISGGTYMWSDGSTDSTLSVNSAQTVTVDIIDAHGCVSSDTSVITQSVNVSLDDSTHFCEGSNVIIDANMTGTYEWNDNSTNQTLSVNAPGFYSVTVSEQNCESSDTIEVIEVLNAIASFTDSSDHFTVEFTNTSVNAVGYSWDFGDGTTSQDVDPIHLYPWSTADSFNYTVTLIAYSANNCGDFDFINDGVRAGQLVSVSEIDLASMINVYPNPNNGVFNVVVITDEAAEMSVEVMDVKGSLVYTNSFGTVNGEVNRTINMEGAAQGIYFVKVTLNGATAVYRLSVN